MNHVILLMFGLVALGLARDRWPRFATIGMVVCILGYIAYAYTHG